MKLSLCLATFNEEKFIHYPLDSAYDFVDEVIIVDGGSTDKTIEIVKSYGPKVKVIKTTNPPMFHINKQKAIEAAKGDWILQLDADEEVSPELKREILETINLKDAMDGYWIPRKNFFLTRFLTKGGQYPDYTIRLYKNGAAVFPRKSVHEQVDVKGEVGYLKKDLLHYADPEFKRYIKRWHRYSTLDAQILVDEGKKPGFFSYLIFKPVGWFLWTYVRHKGFVDGFAGFTFSFFSALRFPNIYFKYQKLRRK